MNNINIYDKWASSYSNKPINPLMKSEHAIINNMLQTLCLNRTVLDAGCGCGRVSNLCLAYGASKVHAFDLSCGMVSACKKLNTDSRLEVKKGDLLKVPYEAEAFDLYVSSLAVGHINNLDLFLSEAHRVLKVRGDLVVSDFHPSRYLAGFKRGMRSQDTYYELEHFVHSVSEWIKTLQDNNFDLLSIFEGFLDRKYYDFELYKDEPDVNNNKEKFDLAFKLPSVWVIHARKK
ncbi:class I SAM-dependent methyltransferase [Vibrio mimicus]